MSTPPIGFLQALRVKIGWEHVSFAIGLAVVGLSAVVLFKLTRDVEFGGVVAALKAKPVDDVMTAAVLVAAAFFALTFYDLFALRTIGRRDVPYRVAAFTNFTSYTIGHNLGATVFTTGLVRYRIYSGWGLSIVDVTKIAFITGLTFWLGNAFVLGAGMAYSPDAAGSVNAMPQWLNRLIGIAGLAAIAGYLLWLLPRRRVIGSGSWSVVLPDARLTLLQIGIGALDLSLVAIAMYVLLPAAPPVAFTTVVVVFVTALLLGFLSHAPGGLGVIEAAMLIGLPQLPKDELLASLLIFRALYFVAPSIAAVTLLLGRELWIASQSASAPRRND